MVIQHNLLSLTAGRQFQINTKKTQRISEQLNSGFRINRAADDAAGLTISEKMRTQIRGLHQASDDLQDGISYVQTADSALAEVQDMLHRVNELTIQSLNDTNTPEDRQAIDDEVQSLKTEIDRIFKTTEFNTRKIWDAEANNPVETGRVTYAPIVTTSANLPSTDISNANKFYIPKRSSDSSDYGSYKLEANEDGIIVTWTDCKGHVWTSDRIKWAEDGEDWRGAHSFNLAEHLHNVPPNSNNGLTTDEFEELKKINNFKYEWNVHKEAKDEDKSKLIAAINATRDSITSRTTTPEQIDLDKTTLPPGISFTYVDIYYNALLDSGKDFDKNDDAFIEATSSVKNVVGNPAVPIKRSDAWEITFNMKGINGPVTVTALSDPGVSYSSSTRAEDHRFDRKYNNHGSVIETTYRPPYGYWWYNDYRNRATGISRSVNAGNTWASIQSAMQTAVPCFEKNCQGPGTIDVSFSLTANGGKRDIGTMRMRISVGAQETLNEVKSRLAQLSYVDIQAQDGGSDYYRSKASVSLSRSASSQQIEIKEMKYLYGLNIQSSDQAFDSIKLVYESMNLATLDLDKCSVDTRSNANTTLEKAAQALNMVSEQRSLFGSYQNRMEHAVLLVNNSEENAQTSESRIRDTDMADAIQKLSVSQILSQASQAMLVQANQTPDRVLQLLQ